MAGTAGAQPFCGGRVDAETVNDRTVVAHSTGGTTYGNRSGLTVIPRMGQIGYRKGLYIGKAENWTADIAIGDAGRCAADHGDSTNLVSFHIDADRLYDTGTPIARACTYWGVDGPEPYRTGVFTVRIYGKICDSGGNNCRDLKPGAELGVFDCGQANGQGYSTTFAPGSNCGPRKWPSGELREAAERGRLSGDAARGYAEWCDFTVDGAKP